MWHTRLQRAVAVAHAHVANTASSGSGSSTRACGTHGFSGQWQAPPTASPSSTCAAFAAEAVAEGTRHMPRGGRVADHEGTSTHPFF